jgi:hypothetical protein
MIIVRLSGGLGNQLFQYSFGMCLAQKHNTKVKFDLQVEIKRADFTPRKFGLREFNIDVELADNREINKFKYFNDGLLYNIERKLIEKYPFINRHLIVEHPTLILNNCQLIDNCYYDGYWQTENYFKPIENQLKNELNLNLNLNKTNNLLEKAIRETLSVSLHIRRSDYISIKANSSIFSECSLTYYKTAIDFFKRKLNNPIFYVFSDDIAWAKQNFKGDSFRIVAGNENNPHADMLLMGNCKHNIIANSSFSWWAAWLNKNKNKIIIAPKNWYNNHSYNEVVIQNILPNSWIKL